MTEFSILKKYYVLVSIVKIGKASRFEMNEKKTLYYIIIACFIQILLIH